MRDAIMLTRQLGIRYIWIDALCIVQDDPEDWNTEASKMADIYAHAALVLSATRSADVHQSIFKERWPTPKTHILTVPSDEEGTGDIKVCFREAASSDLYYLKGPDLTRAPIMSRGWVFQERMLASRTVHFMTEDMCWECEEALWCECTHYDSQGRCSFFTYQLQLHSTFRILDQWRSIVYDYSRRDLTCIQDKLAALHGITAFFNRNNLGKYCFGLWEKELLLQLHWQADLPQSLDPRGFVIPQQHKAIIIGPSWSWISTHSSLLQPDFERPYLTSARVPEVKRVSHLKLVADIRESIVFPPQAKVPWRLEIVALCLDANVYARCGEATGKPKCENRIRMRPGTPETTSTEATALSESYQEHDALYLPDVPLCPTHRFDSALSDWKSATPDEDVRCIFLSYPKRGLGWTAMVIKHNGDAAGTYRRLGLAQAEHRPAEGVYPPRKDIWETSTRERLVLV